MIRSIFLGGAGGVADGFSVFKFCISRPALVVENIPGLQFIGNQRKPNSKIRVEHIVEAEGTNNDGVGVGDLEKWIIIFIFYISRIQQLEVKRGAKWRICL